MRRTLDAVTSWLASAARFGTARSAALGARAASRTETRPRLELFEYEASPWCRLVREHITYLGLSVTVYPCPRETLRAEGAFSANSRFRQKASELNASKCGDLQFPLLVDRTHASGSPLVLTESSAIITHLWKRYGKGVERPKVDKLLSGGTLPFPIRFALLAAPSGLRFWPSCGLLRTPSSFDPDVHQHLELHNQAESCADSRLIRERLSTLEIPCVYHVAQGGAELSHSPVLIDPNHKSGTAFHGSTEALEHLDKCYRAGSTLPLHAGVPEPNLGGPSRSFFCGAQQAMRAGEGGFLPADL